MLQSIVIAKNIMSEEEAYLWVTKHYGKPKKIDVTDKSYRFRQYSPQYLKRLGYVHYATKTLPNGVSLVFAYRSKE